ncbi:uncharacterized protein LOC111573346 [Amphiprion ocellaris]|uniref:uncharacterized protein LOC111573346 n=1 Tax=Amphiprion ocellaris TaxID=80972 RepID=UPI0024114C24|nr:uncharacterized protein LOC111573346 [Amphiprion ocellaris]
MLLGFTLLLLLCESTAVENQTRPINSTAMPETTAAHEDLSFLQVVAVPDYPVAAGQSVSLSCSTGNMSAHVTWFWQHLQHQTWKVVGNGSDLMLTEPQQSGQYRCLAENQLSQRIWSPNHTVYIISIQATVGEYLGMAGFVLSLLSWVFIIAIIFWLSYERLGGTTSTSNTPVKGLPGPQMASKGGLPQGDSDGDVYINYTGSNPAYTDLDPTNMTQDNVYSSI